MTRDDIKKKTGVRPATFLKKRLQHRLCPVNFGFFAEHMLATPCGISK